MKKVYLLTYKDDFDYPETGVSFHWWNKGLPQGSLGTTSLHTHDYYEIFLVTSGHTTHEINGRKVILSKHDLQFVHPTDVHQFLPYGDESSQHINIAITEPALLHLCENFGSDFFDIVASPNSAPVPLSLPDYQYLIELANKITLSQIDALSVQTVHIKKMIVCMLAVLYEKKCLTETMYPDWFNKIIFFLNDPKNIDCTAKDVYKLANYSPAMLLHYFKRFTGQTITAYLQNIKIKYACNLLEKTDLPMLDISSRLGFDSLSHFNHLFKRVMQLSPGEYKKRNH